MKTFLSIMSKVFIGSAILLWGYGIYLVVFWTLVESELTSMTIQKAEVLALTGFLVILAGGVMAVIKSCLDSAEFGGVK